MATFKTRRLLITRLSPDDVSFVMTMEADPEVMRYTTGVVAPTPSRRKEVLAYVNSAPHEGPGHWRVELQGKPIGWISLTPLESTDRFQLAYRFAKAFWGNGYATEAGAAILDYAREVLGLSECAALVWPDNNASTHVLSKLRFQYEGSSVYYGNDVNVFVRTLDV